jgi:hypothetical protein
MKNLTAEDRAALIKKLREGGSTLRPTRILGNSAQIDLEGGKFPATFSGGELSVWGRCSRHAGGAMTVTELVLTEKLVREWYAETFATEEVSA